MKRFLKLYKMAKAYNAKHPLRLAIKCWRRGDTWVNPPAPSEGRNDLEDNFSRRNEISVFHAQCNKCGKVFDDRFRMYYPCPEHPLV